MQGLPPPANLPLALDLAEALNGEIICVDSLTVYRGFEIGSAKPAPEQRQCVPHHLLDICLPTDPFTASDFRAAAAAILDIIERGKRPILAGGTGLYLRSLLRGLNKAPGEDPVLREALRERLEREGEALLAELATVDPGTAQRTLTTAIVLSVPWRFSHRWCSSVAVSDRARFFRKSLRRASAWICRGRNCTSGLTTRVDAMLAAGLVAEVQGLLQAGVRQLQAVAGHRL